MRFADLIFAIAVPFAAYAAEPAQAAYVPRLGEIMGATQIRHAKLWFAGQAGNWDLARYELGEIREGLNDAARFDPVFKGIPVASLLMKFSDQPLEDVGIAIESRDSTKFRESFDKLTDACNACHKEAGRGFIVIQRPTMQPFSNQEFSVSH
jgi:hypothetical protein